MKKEEWLSVTSYLWYEICTFYTTPLTFDIVNKGGHEKGKQSAKVV